MNENTKKAIQTIAGGLFHSIITKSTKELSGRDWELLCTHLKISEDTIHSVSLIPNGFTLTTKTLNLRYVHDSFSSEKRIVELKYPNESITV